MHTVQVAREPRATASASVVTRSWISSRMSSSKERMVPRISTLSGMMFWRTPPLMVPMVTTAGSRATCTVCITKNYPVTINDPALTAAMVPTLQRVAGPTTATSGLQMVPKVTGSEDFSFFQRLVPGLFFFIGITPPGSDPAKAYSNHSPRFFADERAFVLGVRCLAHLSCDYLESRA